MAEQDFDYGQDDKTAPSGMVDEEVLDESSDEADISTFEDEMRERILADFAEAEDYMDPFHQACLERHQMYHNAHAYEDLRKKSKFPMPFYQEQIDVFVADLSDKLFYKNRPCTVSGVEEKDKEDAAVKQEMLDWQDFKDKVYRKLTAAGRDAAMYGICVAQVDYSEIYNKKIVSQDIPIPALDPATGQPILMPDGNFMPQVDSQGNVLYERDNSVVDNLIYQGPSVKIVDPLNLYFPEDKTSHDDGVPVMVRSRHDKKYFKSQSYFFNYDRIDEERQAANTTVTGGDGQRSSGMIPDYADQKRQHRGYNGSANTSKRRDYDYLEWHGDVNRVKLYEYLGYPTTEVSEEDGQEYDVYDADETVHCIAGLVDSQVIVRLEETPFEFDSDNIIIGYIQPEEDDAIGTSLSDKILSVQKGLEVLMGMNIENFKQAIKAGHVINKAALANGTDVVVNKAGAVIMTNQDVRAAHKRIEQPKLAPEILNMVEYFKAMGRDSSGVSKVTSGMGDEGAETLGEANIVAGQAALRMKTYLKSFEETFVQPLYEMRNQINMQFLDSEYVYGVVGDGAIEWRQATPAQVRANVDFVCESSVRETNRSVITQQIIQFSQIAPLALQLGFPVRLDVIFGRLMEQGFSWTTDQVHEVLPSLKMEKDGVDINQMLLQTFLTRLIMQGAMMPAGPEQSAPQGATSPRQEVPQPTSENGANIANQQRNQTQVGAL